MKKQELKTGMLVETRIGNFGLVMLDTPNGDIIAGDGTNYCREWYSLENMNDDLTNKNVTVTESDVVRVYGMGYNIEAASFSTKFRLLLWERQEEVVMTIEEIEKKLGITNLKIKK